MYDHERGREIGFEEIYCKRSCCKCSSRTEPILLDVSRNRWTGPNSSIRKHRWLHGREHVKSVAKDPRLICGRKPSDAHHLRFAQHRALGRKASDEFTVPLCRGHHRELHRCGDEAEWWKKVGIDQTVCARTLWLASHPHPVTAKMEGASVYSTQKRSNFAASDHSSARSASRGAIEGIDAATAPQCRDNDYDL